jgi:tetratricopeptide (TPR) repeat protein
MLRRRMRSRLLSLAFFALLIASACGGPGANGSTMPLDRRMVDDESYGEVRRLYLILAPDDPIRAGVRERLIAHLAERSDALIAAEDYEGVVGLLGDMTSLLAPSDLATAGSVPEAVRPLARFVADVGSRRGDEPRTLAALLLLLRMAGDDAAMQAEYDRVATWGHDARLGASADGSPPSFEHLFDGAVGILEVWQEHARLCPAPEVLEHLSGLFVELTNAFSGGAQLEEGFAPRISPSSLQEMEFVQALLERTPLEIAAVWLAHGDLEAARAHLSSMGDRTGTEWRVRRVVETAMQTDSEGAEALYELAAGYTDARTDVAQAMCRLGVRMHPSDARFPLCLARLTSGEGQIGEGTAWYREAVRLSPDERSVYDEALTQLSHSLEIGAFDDSASGVGQMRQIGRDAEAILAERTQRWPNEPADVTLAALRFSVGRAEMAAGNLAEARTSLQASLDASPTRAALEELASIAMRTGEPARAIELLSDAMNRLTQQGRDGQLERAAILESLGDAHRVAGHTEDAQAAYRQALDIYRPLSDTEDTNQAAAIHVRLGTLVRRLGERGASDREYRLAMQSAPEWREPFAEILAHLVIDGPDRALADETLRAARMGSHLADAWKVYFALWVQLVAYLGDQGTSAEAEELLGTLASGTGWHAELAGIGAGTTSYEHALAAAGTQGQRCEAHFYSGARALAHGDTASARTAFQAALATNMVSYFEYVMAQELLRTLDS